MFPRTPEAPLQHLTALSIGASTDPSTSRSIEMLSVHVAELVQSAQGCADGRVPGPGPDHVGGRATTGEDPDPIDLARGLGAGGARRREGREGEAADEGAPVHHSITWSARSSSDGGIVRPIAFAARIFITSSNFEG